MQIQIGRINKLVFIVRRKLLRLALPKSIGMSYKETKINYRVN